MDNHVLAFHQIANDLETQPNDFALDHWQVGHQPTDYAKYLSAATRMMSAYDSIVLGEIECDECEEALGDAADPSRPEARRYAFKLGKLRARLEMQKRTFLRMFAIAQEIRGRLPDMTDPAVRRELQREAKVELLRRKAALALATAYAQRTPPNVSGIIASASRLPKDDFAQIVTEIRQGGAQWAQQHLAEHQGGEQFEALEAPVEALRALASASVSPVLAAPEVDE